MRCGSRPLPSVGSLPSRWNLRSTKATITLEPGNQRVKESVVETDYCIRLPYDQPEAVDHEGELAAHDLG